MSVFQVNAKRPAIIPNLKSGRAERFERWIRTIHASRRPTLWMKHALLPHGPWVYLPDGRMSRPPGPELLRGMQTIPGFYDDYLRHHNEQRQLLQLGFADRLLGRLTTRLKREGIYDDTMIVVTADHGFAWKVGVPTRRNVSLSNVDELGSVPMIVKRPGQRTGRVSGALAQTLDVTPTIADVLNVPLGYRADGRSVFSHTVAARRTVRIVKRAGSRRFVTFDHARGIETGAPARGRTESGAAISLPRPFWRKSTYTLPPRAASGRATVAISGSSPQTTRASTSPSDFVCSWSSAPPSGRSTCRPSWPVGTGVWRPCCSA